MTQAQTLVLDGDPVAGLLFFSLVYMFLYPDHELHLLLSRFKQDPGLATVTQALWAMLGDTGGCVGKLLLYTHICLSM